MKQDPAPPVDSGRHLSVLEALDGKGNVSQRTLADRLGIAVSVVNRVIRDLMDGGHLEIMDRGVRPFAYDVTSTGRRYLRRLSHDNYRSVLTKYRSMQEKITRRLRQIREEDVHRLVFYGAGEIMEVTLPLAQKLGLEVVGVVDDDPAKPGEERGGLEVRSPECLRQLRPDAVLITTYRHAEEIRGRLEGRLPKGARVLEL